MGLSSQESRPLAFNLLVAQYSCTGITQACQDKPGPEKKKGSQGVGMRSVCTPKELPKSSDWQGGRRAPTAKSRPGLPPTSGRSPGDLSGQKRGGRGNCRGLATWGARSMVRLKNDFRGPALFPRLRSVPPLRAGEPNILSDDLAKNLQSCALDRGSCRCPCLQTSSGWERNLWGVLGFCV